MFNIITELKKRKKLFTSVYELSENSSVFILHYIECNLSTEHQRCWLCKMLAVFSVNLKGKPNNCPELTLKYPVLIFQRVKILR